jgi:hypothetical protein
MDFSNDYIYQLEKRSEDVIVSVLNLAGCSSQISSLSSLSQESFISAKSEDLSVAILSLATALKDCITAGKSSSAAVETLKNDKISCHSKVLKLQEELITMNNEQLKLKTVTDLVQLNLKDSDKNEERHKNVILFGMTENEGESLSGQVDYVLESACHMWAPKTPTAGKGVTS